MKKIALVCNAGMSTSLIVTRMQKEAAAQGVECEIKAFPVLEGMDGIAKDYDVLLVGPQVRHALKPLKEAMGDTPVEVIDMRSYGMMDAKAILKQALDAIKE